MLGVRAAKLTLAALLAAPAAALAHGGGQPWTRPGWTLDPVITVPLVLSLGLYLIGWRKLAGRSARNAGSMRRGMVLFLAGWSLLVAALVSPLHQAGERSFTFHMAEHELLMLAAAPLLVLGRPMPVFLWGFPAAGRQALGPVARVPSLKSLWRTLTDPIVATLLQALALWGWHAPVLFDTALADPFWHAVQHLCFLVTALLFWSAMLTRRHGAGLGPEPLCLFATAMISGALGAFMAFSGSPWYAGYARLGLASFGLTPAEDQQMAGLIMWIPGGLVHAGAALAILAAALREPTSARRAHAL